MRGAVLHAPGDVRVDQRDDPTIIAPTDAVIRLSATCVCGSDLWPYRGIEPVDRPSPMGHEYVGDGAVGLLGVLAARELGAERIIAMSRHAPRQKLALEYGATDIIAMTQAIHSTRPGGHVGYVGVAHDVALLRV